MAGSPFEEALGALDRMEARHTAEIRDALRVMVAQLFSENKTLVEQVTRLQAESTATVLAHRAERDKLRTLIHDLWRRYVPLGSDLHPRILDVLKHLRADARAEENDPGPDPLG